MLHYHIRQCTNPVCRFRFPAADNDNRANQCPHCHFETDLISYPSQASLAILSQIAESELHLELMLDNIRSVYNVGAMLRTADGVGAAHVHLCGITAPPTHPKIVKTALGAEIQLPWTQWRNGVDTAVSLQKQNYQLWALEATADAEPLYSAVITQPERPILFVAGNEKVGVDPGILDLCDRVLCLPMHGHKESLNVSVAFGIALYHIRFGMQISN
ncbi:MAG: TrmH family RNA methyltransferase [Chloroflexi bacterium]|nr:MAG: TrmH family RNA methyltransferase [Chloroflexota bacterium]